MGKADVEQALIKLDEILGDVKQDVEIRVTDLIDKIEHAGFKWGSSNGT